MYVYDCYYFQFVISFVSCVYWRTPADTVMITIVVLTVKTTAPPDVYLGPVTR